MTALTFQSTKPNLEVVPVDAKPYYKSKMMILNALTAVVFMLQAQEVLVLFPSDWMPTIAGIVAVANMILRWTTTTALTK